MARRGGRTKCGAIACALWIGCSIWFGLPGSARGQSEPYKIWNVEVVSQMGGDKAGPIAVDGHYIYLCKGHSLVILDVSNPASPVVVGRVVLPNAFYLWNGVSVAGGLAVVNSGGQLLVIDVADPSAPIVRSTYDPPIPCNRPIAVSNGVVYCAGEFVRVVDLSDPSSPTYLTSYGHPYIPGLYPEHIQLEDDTAYIGDNSGFTILDVTNPSSPTLLGASWESVSDMHVDGDYAYVHYGALKIIDVSNPSSPTLVGSYPSLPGRRVSASGGLAFKANHSGALLYIVDVSDPTSPILAGTYPIDGSDESELVSTARIACVTTPRGFELIDATNPTSPMLRGQYGELATCWDLAFSDGTAYVVGEDRLPWYHNNSIEVLDVSTPRRMRTLGFVASRYPAERAALASGFLYGATYEGIVIADVSDPASPTVAEFYEMPVLEDTDIQIVGDRLFNVSRAYHFQIHDLTDPTSPALLYSDPTTMCLSFSIAGDRAYLINEGRLRILDVGDPTLPVLLGTYPTRRWSVSVQDNLAYLAQDSLEIVDVRDPSSPTMVGQFDISARRVRVAGQLAYLYAGNDTFGPSMNIVDISDPTSPTRRGYFGMSRTLRPPEPSITSVHAHDGLIYAAMGGRGLWVLNYTGPRPPATATRSRWRFYR